MDKLVLICWKLSQFADSNDFKKENVLMYVNNSQYTRQTSSFTTSIDSIFSVRRMYYLCHKKAFDSAMVDEFELNSCKYLGIIFIKIVGYTLFGNEWIAILILSGTLKPYIK